MQCRFLAILLLPITSFADNPFACVDPDVTAAFLDSWYQDASSFSKSAPAEFADVELPTSLDIVGSRRGEWSVSVVYKTGQDAEMALSEVAEVLSNTGWSDATRKSRGATGGFQSQSRPEIAVFCREDGPGILRVSAKEKNETTYLSLSRDQDQMNNNCDSFLSHGHRRNDVDLMTFLPVLELPKGVKTSHHRGGGSGDQVHTGVQVTTDMDRNALMGFLGDQVRDQDWDYDASWAGSTSLGSIWIRDISETGLLIGTLSISGTSGRTYRVQFDLAPADP